MMPLQRTRLCAGLAIAGLLLLIGCTPSRPTQLYMLSKLTPATVPNDSKPIRLGVGPVDLPAYLDRPQMVTRNGANRITVAEFDQWAEPLETGLQRVLIEDLAHALATDGVETLPARRSMSLDHQIKVDVARFDANEAGLVILDARWKIFDGQGDRLMKSGRSIVRQHASAAGDYREIAAAMSRCIAIMSGEIADTL